MTYSKLQYKLPLYIAISMAVGIVIGAMLSKKMLKKDATNKLANLVSLLGQNYVDSINTDSLYQKYATTLTMQQDSTEAATLQHILATLDPHSIYLNPQQLKQANEQMNGSFAGIGIEYIIIQDTLTITNVLPTSPAAKAALAIGDRIIKAQDSSLTTKQLGLEQLRGIFRGAAGSTIKLTVISNGILKQVVLTRDNIALTSIDASYMLTSSIGYIKLNKFSFVSYKECRDALQQLTGSGMQQLVLDLRGNGGGSLRDACALVDELLDSSKLITYTVGAHQARDETNCSYKGLFEKGAIALLVDEQSASASEVVAGALQDWDRATVIGRRTYGKGLVQRQYGLQDGSAVRLTIARYYTPTGRSIQKTYNGDISNYYHEVQDRAKKNSLLNADSNKLETGKIYTTKQGKKVYGGGGITPDIFIPIDTTVAYNKTLQKIVEKNIITQYSVQYYNTHKPEIIQYSSPKAFAENFKWSATELNQIILVCAKDSINWNMLSTAQKDYVLNRMKQYLAKYHWQINGYYTAYNLTDSGVLKAIQVLSTKYSNNP